MATPPAPAEYSDRAHIVTALEQNLLALWSRFGRGDGCTLHELDDAIWFDTPARIYHTTRTASFPVLPPARTALMIRRQREVS